MVVYFLIIGPEKRSEAIPETEWNEDFFIFLDRKRKEWNGVNSCST